MIPMLRSLLVCCIASAALALSPVGAQAPAAPVSAAARGDTITEVRLRDGSVLYGRVVEDTRNVGVRRESAAPAVLA